MSLDYIRGHYSVPAKRADRIRFTGSSPAQDGTILGAKGQYLSVRFDDGQKGNLHPTWEVEYLGAAEAGCSSHAEMVRSGDISLLDCQPAAAWPLARIEPIVERDPWTVRF